MSNVIDYREKLQEATALLQGIHTAGTIEGMEPDQIAEIARLRRRVSILKRWEAVENAHA